MNDLDHLPAAPLRESGRFGRRFHQAGISTFREACEWIRDVPYGSNHVRHNPFAVFDEMRGTCQSKHDVIASLAGELALPVHKYLGGYRLDGSVLEGADIVLAGYGLAYVPQMHCVLRYRDRLVDLTAGNCHGKKRDITDIDVFFRVEPFASEQQEQAVYELCVRYYRQTDARIGLRSVTDLRRIAAECREHAKASCPTV